MNTNGIKKETYKDYFYGKRRIACFLLLVNAILIYKTLETLLRVKAMMDSRLELMDFNYSSNRPSKISFTFRLLNYKSPFNLSISKFKLCLNEALEFRTEQISLKKMDDFIVNVRVSLDKCNLRKFDWKNFNLAAECRIALGIFYVPFLFLVSYDRRIEIYAKGKTDRTWYNELNLMTTTKTHLTYESIICTIDKHAFFKSYFGDENNVNVKFADLQVFLSPAIFDKIKIHGFRYNKQHRSGLIKMEIIRSYDNKQFGTYLIDFIKYGKPLYIEHLVQNEKTHAVHFDPLFRTRLQLIPPFTEPYCAIRNFCLKDGFSCNIEFAKDSFNDFVYLCAYFLLKNKTVQFHGLQNEVEILTGTIKFRERGIELAGNILDYNPLFRFCIYPEPRMALELVDDDDPVVGLFRGVRYVTNLFRNHEILYRNRAAAVMEGTVDFMKKFDVEHHVKEHAIGSDKTRVEIVSTCSFRNTADLNQSDLSNFCLFELKKDILFRPRSSRLGGDGRVVHGAFYYEMSVSPLSRRLYGQFKMVTNLNLLESALRILNTKGADAIFNLFGTEFRFVFEDDKAYDITTFLLGPDCYGFTNCLNTGNFRDKSLFFNDNFAREDPDVRFGKFLFEVTDFKNLVSFDASLSTAPGGDLDAFVDRVHPRGDQRLLFDQRLFFDELQLRMSAVRGTSRYGFLDAVASPTSIRFTFVDGFLYMDMPGTARISITAYASFFDASSPLFVPKGGSWLTALVGNFVMVQVLRDDTPITKKQIRNWSNFGTEINFSIDSEQHLVVVLDLNLPRELVATNQAIVFSGITPISVTARRVTDEIFFTFNVTEINSEDTLTIRSELRLCLDPDTLTAPFSFSFSFSSSYGSRPPTQTSLLCTSDFFRWFYFEQERPFDQFKENAMKPKLKVIAHTVTGTDCSDSEAKVLRLSGQFHIEADMLVAEASSKIVEFFKSEFLAASFYVKYDFHHLSIFRILHQKRLFIDIGELKTSGFLTYPLAYSRVMYDISADDPEKYYDYPYAIHKAVFTDQGVSQTVHFVDRDLDDCGMGCCGTGDGDYTATRLDDTLLKVRQLPGKTFYRYQEFTRNGEPVYYNPHVANANCTVEAEIRVYEDAWADMGDYSSFTTDSPLCLGLARIQSRAEAEVDCTVFFITVLEGSVSHAGIHFRVPVRILVDNTSQFTGITALIHDGGDMWILADVRDPLEDTTINEVGHNFSIPFYIARRGDVPPGIGYLNQEASHRASLYFKAYGTAIMFHFPGKINKKLLMFFLDWMTWGASKLYVYKLFYSNANDLVKSKFETTRNPEDRNTTTQSRFKWIQYIKIAKELVVIQNKKSQAMLRLERVFRETMVEIDTVFVE